jgi:hypothetical protein
MSVPLFTQGSTCENISGGMILFYQVNQLMQRFILSYTIFGNKVELWFQ